MTSTHSKPLQSAQTTVDALRLAVLSRLVAPDERVWWIIEQILAFAPPSESDSVEGVRAFQEAIKDYWGNNAVTEIAS